MSRKMMAAQFALLLAFVAPAHAWEFTPGTPCLLTHETDDVAIRLTYDPTVPLYSISLTQSIPFAPAPIFSMQFVGPLSLQISTDRHRMSDQDRTVTVFDSGFGNVLNGLQYNEVAIARLGPRQIAVSLTDAADAVAAFRECDVVPAA